MNLNRVRCLKPGAISNGPIVYWMSRDQRSRDNWALLFAQQQALMHQSPLRVIFSLAPKYLDAFDRQYTFMLHGLQEVAADLKEKNISFEILSGTPGERISRYVLENSVSMLITDFDPIQIKREWKIAVLENTNVPVYEVDAHNIIPCWIASLHQEFGAYTLRPKIHRQLPAFTEQYPLLHRHPYGDSMLTSTTDWNALEKLHLHNSSQNMTGHPAGQSAALRKMHSFIDSGLDHYDETRNDPSLNGQSKLSPYLHFGQLSAQRILQDISNSHSIRTSQDAFLEELVVRREIADNFCYYNPNYDNIKGFPGWAQKTLEKHLHDTRPYIYDRDALETSKTHDRAWNAAQAQLIGTGVMHGYMRMYWAKKILEWSKDPETAMKTAIYFNDHYALDGRDPNGYTGIAWSMGGVHDRAWGERQIFGKIRYMNYAGLQRKFKINAYIDRYT